MDSSLMWLGKGNQLMLPAAAPGADGWIFSISPPKKDGDNVPSGLTWLMSGLQELLMSWDQAAALHIQRYPRQAGQGKRNPLELQGTSANRAQGSRFSRQAF